MNQLKKAVWICLISCAPSLGSADTDFTPKKITIDGAKRIDSQRIEHISGLEAGQKVDKKQANKIIGKLYKTGFFKNVAIKRNEDQLILKVDERPVISSVNITGNKNIPEKKLKPVLQKMGIQTGNMLSEKSIFQLKQGLLNQYHQLGYTSATIDVDQSQLPRNRVALSIHISEGKKATIRRINIFGEADQSNQIASQLPVSTPSIWNLWGLLSSKTTFSPMRQQQAKESLQNFYLDHGYLDAQVTDNQASLTPDKENAYLMMSVDPGEQYTVGQINITGSSIVPIEQLKHQIALKKGQVFSKSKLKESVQNIVNVLKNKGYALAKVTPEPQIDVNDHTVRMNLKVQPGKKVYIRHVNFKGNNVTNDYVYRQRLQYYEQGAYNQGKIQDSKLKLQQLPYVQSINVDQKPVEGHPDQVDLDYHIDERSANQISANIGYSQMYKFMVGGNLSMPNVLGTGNAFSINAQLSKIRQNLNLSYTNPFFTDTGISQSLSAYMNQTNYDRTSVANYQLTRYGGNINYGIPATLNNQLNAGVGFDHTRPRQPSGGESSIVSYYDKTHDGLATNTFRLNLGWSFDSTNHPFFPTKGKKASVHSTLAVPGSDVTWYKINASGDYFKKLNTFTTLQISGGIGYGQGYGKTDRLPFFENFYGGGWGSVRGFNQGSLGPADQFTPNDGKSKKGRAIGGNFDIHASIDLLFPVPGLSEQRNVQWGMFLDAGNVYDTSGYPDGVLSPDKPNPSHPTLNNLKYSTGLELRWRSPIGPMAFDLGWPLNAKDTDDVQVFQFRLGYNFT